MYRISGWFNEVDMSYLLLYFLCVLNFVTNYWWNVWTDFQAFSSKLEINHYGSDSYKILRRTEYFIFNGKGGTSKFVSLLLKSLEDMHNDDCVICSCVVDTLNSIGACVGTLQPFKILWNCHNIAQLLPAYGVFISQLIRYAQASSSYECFTRWVHA